MRTLVVGGGGREHALAYALSRSPSVEAVLCAPGNPGTALVAENVPVPESDAAALTDLALARSVDLVVVGPEAPLAAGLADRLRAAGVTVFGPGAAAARLESSKAFAKELMATLGVPTAPFAVCDDPASAHRAADRMGAPVVVKADGLASGKGVVVATDIAEAHAAIDAAMAGARFGEAGRTVVVEAFVDGPEASAFAVCDGERFALLPFARDHKRLLAGDRGPNTGGMGAMTPVPGLGPAELARVGDEVFAPVLAALARRGAPFRGLLYAGLKWTASGPVVLEFNVRFGDPEAQALVMAMRGDAGRALHAAATGILDPHALRFEGAGAAVVAAAPGYPDAVRTGGAIAGAEPPWTDGTVIFQAGTERVEGGLRVRGGRVLAAAAGAPVLDGAIAAAYAALARVKFQGMQVRADIGRT